MAEKRLKQPKKKAPQAVSWYRRPVAVAAVLIVGVLMMCVTYGVYSLYEWRRVQQTTQTLQQASQQSLDDIHQEKVTVERLTVARDRLQEALQVHCDVVLPVRWQRTIAARGESLRTCQDAYGVARQQRDAFDALLQQAAAEQAIVAAVQTARQATVNIPLKHDTIATYRAAWQRAQQALQDVSDGELRQVVSKRLEAIVKAYDALLAADTKKDAADFNKAQQQLQQAYNELRGLQNLAVELHQRQVDALIDSYK